MTRRRRSLRTPLTLFVALGALLAATVPGTAGATNPSPPVSERPEIVDPQLRAEMDAAAATGDQVEYLVSMAATPDLAAIKFDRAAVVAGLRETAEETQAPVVAALRARGDEVLNTFWMANQVLARSSAESMLTLTAIPGVEAILPVIEMSVPEPEPQVGFESATVEDRTWGIDRIRAHRVWDELGTDGSGTRVAVLDSGVDISHPDLAGRMVTDDPDDPRFPGGWMEFDAASQPVASSPHDTG